MKWVLILFFLIYLHPVAVCSQNNIAPQISSFALHSNLKISKKISVFQFIILQTRNEQTTESKDKSVGDYVTFILLWLTTLLAVITPLTLIYLWIYYSSVYVKKYRSIFSVKKWIFGKNDLANMGITNTMRLSYRKIYSLMIGFGISIVAYSIASIRFMLLNFDEMETALIEYFRFPFLTLDEFGLIHNSRELEIKFDYFWNQMLLIVVVSAMFFLIGYLLGSLLVDFRLKFLNKHDQESPRKISIKKEMFHLKTKKDHSIHSGV